MPSPVRKSVRRQSTKATATHAHGIRIKHPKFKRREWTEAELLKGVTRRKVGGEIDWGSALGIELW